MNKRIIAHLDMDTFFASVEEAITPGFKGKPIVVGTEPNGGKGRGVVSTANYKAREYGIHSAMPISIAWRLSEAAKKQGKEKVIFLPVDFELYDKVSENVLQIIRRYLNNVEQASIDEFYFDLSFTNSFKKAEDICKKIKEDIKKKEKITCSVGIAPNKLIAKIAAGIKKPNGMFLVQEKNVRGFLNPLSIREIPGIGPKTAEIFYQINAKIISDLIKFSKEELKKMMGKRGESIYNKIRGIDDDPVIEYREVKSIGKQITFNKDTLDASVILDMIKKLSDSVLSIFAKSNFSAFKTITITVRFSNFETKTSSKSFKPGISKNNMKNFEIEIFRMILPFLDKRSNPRRKPIRLIGVRVEKLS
ncbi:MAG: DNA polymerase IV [bacterium]|nr:DNA polymerase IV [bacterium]